ncbi:DNA polymerase III subunit delta [Alkalithermobacter paradoxus]|uniref:DNA polymerase III subunit delta n=1 Tax=Alkalithermobacter paradoxus TaxID=29349 RepID=A0A1V4I6Q6_9FIRM|nr:DNA polymerase III subunit delta [[Clostridium] thermoalcaliphilum]
MEYTDIIKDMKKGVYKRLYLFYGKESYLLDNVFKVAKQNLNESFLDFNFSVMDGKEINLDTLIGSVETFPFMDERKIIIVKDFELLKGKKRNFSNEDEEELIRYFSNMPQTSTLIFIVYGDIDKRKKIVKEIQSNGLLVNCDKLRGNDLLKWADKKFKNYKSIIDYKELIYFLSVQDYENKNSTKTLSDLENEIIKISSFVGRENKVTKEIIDELSTKKVDNDIFKLIEAIGNKNCTLGVKILNDIISEGESSLMVLSMIARQFRIIMQCKELQVKGYSSKIIAQKLGLHPYVVTKALKQSDVFDESAIVKTLNECIQTDFCIKNGLIKDKIALEMLITSLCI